MWLKDTGRIPTAIKSQTLLDQSNTIGHGLPEAGAAARAANNKAAEVTASLRLDRVEMRRTPRRRHNFLVPTHSRPYEIFTGTFSFVQRSSTGSLCQTAAQLLPAAADACCVAAGGTAPRRVLHLCMISGAVRHQAALSPNGFQH